LASIPITTVVAFEALARLTTDEGRAIPLKPACSANATSGTRPLDDTRFGSSKLAPANGRVCDSWSGSPGALLRRAPSEPDVRLSPHPAQASPAGRRFRCSLVRLLPRWFRVRQPVDEAVRGLIVAVWTTHRQGVIAAGRSDGSGALFPLVRALRTMIGVKQERAASWASSVLPQQHGRGDTAEQRIRLASPLGLVPV